MAVAIFQSNYTHTHTHIHLYAGITTNISDAMARFLEVVVVALSGNSVSIVSDKFDL